MSDQRNEIDTWQQGVFCEEPRYSHIPKSSKDEFIRSEKLRVRPHPKGNAICLCNQPEDAAWIAERLNLAVELERKIAAVTAERDRLRRDKARLDSGRMKVAIANPNGIGGTVGILELDLRAAIDAATEGGAR